MSPYYLIIIFTGVFGLLTFGIRMQRSEDVDGVRVQRYSWFWAIAAVIPLLYFATTRTNVGDTEAYVSTFLSMPSTLQELDAYSSTLSKDAGFYIFSALIKIIFGSSRYTYFFIVAAIQTFCFVKIYRKYSTHYAMSIFLFLISTDYISWMFNGIRQFMAVCFIFAATTLLLKKKYIPLIIVIIIAAQFHGTAYLMLPFIFIVQGKAWNKKTIAFLFAIIIAVTFIDQFTDVLDSALQDTQYENVVSDWTSWNDDGTNILRVLVYAIPAILSLIGYKKIQQANDPLINLCSNMSIVGTGFYIISMFTSGIFIGRLPIYFTMYNYILLPWEVDNLFDKNTSQIVKVIMVTAYIGYYLYAVNNL